LSDTPGISESTKVSKVHKARLRQLELAILAAPQLRKDRPPKPFAKTPTRVAWSIEANFGTQDYAIPDGRGGMQLNPGTSKIEKLSYVGKPCRYRAIEAMKFIQKVSTQGRLLSSFQCEFDRADLVAYLSSHAGFGSCDAYFAYHPQGGDANPILAFSKPVYLKVIGKFPTYSHQKRLSQEQIDQFYAWFSETFDQAKLKRPRKKSQKAAFEPAPQTLNQVAYQYFFDNEHGVTTVPVPVDTQAVEGVYDRYLREHPLRQERPR
jgi:hypothetical protein